MQCPLPIDWIEYVEGAASDVLTHHLKECGVCRLLVDELRQHRREQLIKPRIPIGQKWPAWPESRPAQPSFGELWWISSSLISGGVANTRLLLVVLSEAWEECGDRWCDVAPVTSDIENATALDLVLRRQENSLSVPLRVLFRYQTVANINDLQSRVG